MRKFGEPCTAYLEGGKVWKGKREGGGRGGRGEGDNKGARAGDGAFE